MAAVPAADCTVYSADCVTLGWAADEYGGGEYD